MFTKLSKLEKAQWNSLDQTVDKPQPLLEVTALGLKGSGKTALLRRLIGQDYRSTKSTDGFRSVRFRVRLLSVEKEVDVKINDVTLPLFGIPSNLPHPMSSSFTALLYGAKIMRHLEHLNFCANRKAILLFVIDGSSQSFGKDIDFFRSLCHHYSNDNSSCSDHFVHGDPSMHAGKLLMHNPEDGYYYGDIKEPGQIIIVFTKADLGKPDLEAMTICKQELEKLYPSIKYIQLTSAVTGEGILTEWLEDSLEEGEHILDRQILTLFEQLGSTKNLLRNVPMSAKKILPKQEVSLLTALHSKDMPEIRSRVQKLEAKWGFFNIKKEDLNKKELAKNEFFDLQKK